MNSQPNTAHLAKLIWTVVAASCAGSADDRRAMAQAATEALQPRDMVEAMLVARIVAAHHAMVDCYQRAAQPGLSDSSAVTLRNNAFAAGRSFDAAMRMLEKRRAAAAKLARSQVPAAPKPQPQAEAAAIDPRIPRDGPRNGSDQPAPAGKDGPEARLPPSAFAEAVANRTLIEPHQQSRG